MKNSHLKHINEGLLGYPSPINALSKMKRAMHNAMRKYWSLPFKHFAARLTEINNYLPLFTGSRKPNNMPPEELNEILIHNIPNVWENQSYIKVWDFKGKT